METIESLRIIGASEYRMIPTGTHHRNRNGRLVEDTKGVEFVRTSAGFMEKSAWNKRMLEAVYAEGQADLLYKIIDHCSILAWLKNEDEIIQYSLECLSSETYKHWTGFDN